MNSIPDRIRKRIDFRMQDPGRCCRDPVLLPLFWISLIYGGVIKIRRSLYRKRIMKARRLPRPVISVGNLTTGGTGKTPMVACLAELLKDRGYRVAVLSRGYQGKASKYGGVVSDGESIFMTPPEAGDEPFMLAQQLQGIPILVGANRFLSRNMAVKQFNSEVLILDDGFQHLSLERDLNLVLLDYQRPLANGYLLPRGFLREPISALEMADGFVLTRCDPASVDSGDIPGFLKRAASQGKPIFHAAHSPRVCRVKEENRTVPDFESIEGKRGVAFSGIALNDDFQRSLRFMGYDIDNCFEFPDHHPYTREELERIWRRASGIGASLVATTEKDYMRIRGRIPAGIPLVVIGVRLKLLRDESKFSEWIQYRIDRAMARCELQLSTGKS